MGTTIRSMQTCLVVAVALQLILPVYSLNAYGHAFSRPNDFTDAQYQAIASNFTVFTVEKDTAASVYGNGTTKPFKSNSIAATIGVARKLKATNPRIKVLMYWNSALHFNLYECESEVQGSWLVKNPNPAKNLPFYNYASCIPCMVGPMRSERCQRQPGRA